MGSRGRDGREAPLTAFLIAGEESGDILGAELMRALSQRLAGAVRFAGVGGRRMSEAGNGSIFPMEVNALHGLSAVIANLPSQIARIRSTAAAVVEADPDVLILVDSPAFNLRVARKVRRASPAIAIVDYVSPTVWAYAPWRARWMAAFVDQVLAILPFEPAVHRRLGGPPCAFVGHPITERLDRLRSAVGERRPIGAGDPLTLLVLPGSRRSEIDRLLACFGETVRLVAARSGPLEVLLPAVPALADDIRRRVRDWPVQPQIVEGEDDKLSAFRRADAALAAAGTVTLELALAGIPMVVGYRFDPLARLVMPLVKARSLVPNWSIVLPNLILESSVVPEFLNGEVVPERLASAIVPLLAESPERAHQLDAFRRLDSLMSPGA
ncbi:MAG: lipid-A-disaccharide synthase, partial [Bauldia sp.]